MQRILDPARIEAFAQRSIPRIRLPDRARVFTQRAERLRALATQPIGQAIAEYLRLMAALADAQQSALATSRSRRRVRPNPLRPRRSVPAARPGHAKPAMRSAGATYWRCCATRDAAGGSFPPRCHRSASDCAAAAPADSKRRRMPSWRAAAGHRAQPHPSSWRRFRCAGPTRASRPRAAVTSWPSSAAAGCARCAARCPWRASCASTRATRAIAICTAPCVRPSGTWCASSAAMPGDRGHRLSLDRGRLGGDPRRVLRRLPELPQDPVPGEGHRRSSRSRTISRVSRSICS